MKPNQILLQQATNYFSRLLSWQNREPFSSTYGCFDRTFWCWKFTDFAGARFQEGVYALAYFYRHSSGNNNIFEHPQALEWILAGMQFWQKLQYKDGSFDEAYPSERSLAATAFTSFYVGEAYLKVNMDLSPKDQDSMVKTFKKAGDWLCFNDEKHGVLSNHLAAAAGALYTIYRITGEEIYKKRCNYFLQRIYKYQSNEGWYEEYGGADPGYQTHGTFYLARIWQLSKDEKLLKSLKKSLSFLKYFIHPDRTLGGEYASRSTEFYFPAGFEILAEAIEDAALIAEFMRKTIEDQSSVGLSSMDAYNFLPMLNNYLFAADNATKIDNTNNLPWQKEKEKKFSKAGLFVKSTSRYYAIFGASKGGVLKVFSKQQHRILYNDCGYWARTGNGIISSQHLHCLPIPLSDDNGLLTIKSDFVQINQKVFNPFLFMGFRLFSLTLGRIKKISYWLKNLLVEILVSRKQKSALLLTRTVIFGEKEIKVKDHIKKLDKRIKIEVLKRGHKFSTIHMGSSRYFQGQELDIENIDNNNYADEFNQNGFVEIKKTISI